MATVVKKILNISNVPLSTVKSLFDSLGASIISTSLSNEVLTIRIDNIVSITFRNYTVEAFDENGSSISSEMYNPFTYPHTFIVGYSDSLFYLEYRDAWSRGIVALYEVIDTRRYFGALGGSSGWTPISSVQLKQIENQNYYQHKTILNYAVPSGTLDYAVDMLFENGNTIVGIMDPNTVTCTAVTQNNKITFDGHNYYSLSSNTLARLD